MSVLRTTILAIAVVSIAAPVAAQQASVTRAQVRAELAELLAAGYNPSDKIHYPDNLQAAEQRIQAQRAARALASGQPVPRTQAVADTSSGAAAMTNEAVGGAKGGTSVSGGPQQFDLIPSTCHGFPVCTSNYIGR